MGRRTQSADLRIVSHQCCHRSCRECGREWRCMCRCRWGGTHTTLYWDYIPVLLLLRLPQTVPTVFTNTGTTLSWSSTQWRQLSSSWSQVTVGSLTRSTQDGGGDYAVCLLRPLDLPRT